MSLKESRGAQAVVITALLLFSIPMAVVMFDGSMSSFDMAASTSTGYDLDSGVTSGRMAVSLAANSVVFAFILVGLLTRRRRLAVVAKVLALISLGGALVGSGAIFIWGIYESEMSAANVLWGAPLVLFYSYTGVLFANSAIRLTSRSSPGLAVAGGVDS
ncbi:hypothetical protein [Salinispora vitiensis]|uniref:hypothetical protein n=1 Tax=Salinispora vitiensis TaxID=999544 RepID=UPI000487DBEE|nr:hypothetical protein [Salinispora vitiensis]